MQNQLVVFQVDGRQKHQQHRNWYNRTMTEKLDARGIPTNECPTCANRLFTVQVSFDDDYLVAQYFTDAECAMCGTLVTAPTPLDHPEYHPQDVRWL